MNVAFCFPGQGSQIPGMGQEFASDYASVREVYDEASEAAGFDVAAACFHGTAEELMDTRVQQPALVATSLACLRAVEETGLRAAAVVGHSVGEYAALAAAEVVSVPTAIELVRERGKAMADVATEHPGSMAAIIGLDDAVVEELCDEVEGAWLANYNCPGQVVVSGRQDAIARLLEKATEKGARRVVPLRVSGAFHSPLVRAVGDRLAPVLSAATWLEPKVPFVSTVSGVFENADGIPAALLDQLAGPVLFTQAVRTLIASGIDAFIELGPGRVLSGLVKRCDRSVATLSINDREGLAKLDGVLGARA